MSVGEIRSKIILFLASHGVGLGEAQKVAKIYGDNDKNNKVEINGTKINPDDGFDENERKALGLTGRQGTDIVARGNRTQKEVKEDKEKVDSSDNKHISIEEIQRGFESIQRFAKAHGLSLVEAARIYFAQGTQFERQEHDDLDTMAKNRSQYAATLKTEYERWRKDSANINKPFSEYIKWKFSLNDGDSIVKNLKDFETNFRGTPLPEVITFFLKHPLASNLKGFATVLGLKNEVTDRQAYEVKKKYEKASLDTWNSNGNGTKQVVSSQGQGSSGKGQVTPPTPPALPVAPPAPQPAPPAPRPQTPAVSKSTTPAPTPPPVVIATIRYYRSKESPEPREAAKPRPVPTPVPTPTPVTKNKISFINSRPMNPQTTNPANRPAPPAARSEDPDLSGLGLSDGDPEGAPPKNKQGASSKGQGSRVKGQGEPKPNPTPPVPVKPAVTPAPDPKLPGMIKIAQEGISNAEIQRNVFLSFADSVGTKKFFKIETGQQQVLYTAQQITDQKEDFAGKLNQAIKDLQAVLAKTTKTYQEVKDAYDQLQVQVGNIVRQKSSFELFIERHTQYKGIAQAALTAYNKVKNSNSQLANQLKTAHDDFWAATKSNKDFESKKAALENLIKAANNSTASPVPVARTPVVAPVQPATPPAVKTEDQTIADNIAGRIKKYPNNKSVNDQITFLIGAIRFFISKQNKFTEQHKINIRRVVKLVQKTLSYIKAKKLHNSSIATNLLNLSRLAFIEVFGYDSSSKQYGYAKSSEGTNMKKLNTALNNVKESDPYEALLRKVESITSPYILKMNTIHQFKNYLENALKKQFENDFSISFIGGLSFKIDSTGNIIKVNLKTTDIKLSYNRVLIQKNKAENFLKKLIEKFYTTKKEEYKMPVNLDNMEIKIPG